MAAVPIVYRVVLRHFLPRLLPAWFAVLLLVSQLDAIIRWGLLRQQIGVEPPLAVGLLGCGLIAAWSLGAAAALAGARELPAMRWILRQPLPARETGSAALLATAPAWPLPLALGWLLSTAPTWPLLAAALAFASGGLAWLVALRRLGTAAALLALTAVGLASGHGLGLAFGQTIGHALGALVLLVGLLAALPFLGDAVQRPGRVAESGDAAEAAGPVGEEAGEGRDRWPAGWLAASPGNALLRRNLLCLARCHRGECWTAVAAALPLAALFAAFRFNGGLGENALWIAYVILLSIASLPAYGVLEALAESLPGRQGYLPRMPIRAGQRIAALLATGALLLAPATFAFLAVALPPLAELTAAVLLLPLGLLTLLVLAFVLRVRFLPRSNGAGVHALLTFLAALLALHAPLAGPLAAGIAALALAHALFRRNDWADAVSR